MKRHLTDKGIQAVKVPSKGQLEVFDLGYPGLALRVGIGGAKSFILFYRHRNKLSRVTLGRWPEVSLAEARERWRKTREAVAKGEDPSPRPDTKPDALAFERVVEEWLRRDVGTRNKASGAQRVGQLVEFDMLPAWRGRRIDEITSKDVIALLDAIMDRGAVVKARRVYAHLHRLFKWCRARHLITADPMEGLEKPGSEKSRERALTDAELTAVWQGCDAGPFGNIVKMLILTGARREEIGQLKWSEIQGDQIYLAGHRTKNGQPHIIPLTKPALDLLASVPRIVGHEHVFTAGDDKPVSGWSRAKSRLDKASGVKEWRVHDLRRTLAVGMQKLQIGLQVVESILGHSAGSRAGIVGVYQVHNYAVEKRQALDTWSAYVFSQLKQSS
jgi:integrase